jgi:Family of unknown function (DUF5330)
MMFLLRAAFWLAILVLLLPNDEQHQSQVYGTAEATVKDVSGFCDRNPAVCETGKGAFHVFVQKAEFGAQMLMGFIKERTAAPASDSQDGTGAGSAAEEPTDAKQASTEADPGAWTVMPLTAEPASGDADGSQSTLNPDDLAPAWDGPGGDGSQR